MSGKSFVNGGSGSVGVRLPWLVVSPHSNHALAFVPDVFAIPFNVALVPPTALAGEVCTTGIRAIGASERTAVTLFQKPLFVPPAGAVSKESGATLSSNR